MTGDTALFVAYSAIWILICAYLFFLHRKLRQLENKVN